VAKPARPAIPVEIQRAVLVECGHRCAIPRCNQTELDFHHIVPWVECKKHEYSNLIALCPTCHRRAHNKDIDRKSLMIYKENLAKEFGTRDKGTLAGEIVEIHRRIEAEDRSTPGFLFKFDFPEFPSAVERIVTRNIEAWGHELLDSLRIKQAEWDANPPEFEYCDNYPRPELRGTYKIIRRDDQVISVRYAIEHDYVGAGFINRSTRVLNFLLKPFRPITLEYVLGDITQLPRLASLIRQKLAGKDRYDAAWLEKGTRPTLDNFSLFNVDNLGLTFIFPAGHIACKTEGEETQWVSLEEIAEFCDSSSLERLDTCPF
jgi:hypothetical protein